MVSFTTFGSDRRKPAFRRFYPCMGRGTFRSECLRTDQETSRPSLRCFSFNSDEKSAFVGGRDVVHNKRQGDEGSSGAASWITERCTPDAIVMDVTPIDP